MGLLRPLSLRMSMVLTVAAAFTAVGCSLEPEPDERNQTIGYRSGTINDAYLSSGERGNVNITEIHWAGSVERVGDGYIHDPDDDFIELQNKHNRPMHFTRWMLEIETGHAMDTLPMDHTSRQTMRRLYILPERSNGRPVEPNEFIVIARRRDGAFADADYFVEDLDLPDAPFSVTLRDLDERLIDGAGDSRKPIFAGAWDTVTARSMERSQLLFNNRGDRDMSWHSYALNDFSVEEDAELHQRVRVRVAEPFRERTLASPGFSNTPDYAGTFASGDFQ